MATPIICTLPGLKTGLRMCFSRTWKTRVNADTCKFPYDARQRPVLPMVLHGPAASLETVALVDSGADVNVLPWRFGSLLGLVWQPEKATIKVSGVPNRAAAMPFLLSLSFGLFSDVIQAFAWCQSDTILLVLGQTNFFMEFDICFFRTRLEFQVVRRLA